MMRIFRKGERYVLSRPKVLFDFHKSGLVTLLICLFSFHFVCFAQESRLGGTTGIGEIKPLQIGDTIPSIFFQTVFSTYDKGKTINKTLNDLKGKHLIIDFWNTWCGPCVTGLSKMIKHEENKNFVLLGVTDQSISDVEGFLSKTSAFDGLKMMSIVADTILKTYFPHVGIPHLVWIDSEGKIKALTGSKDISERDINSFLSNSSFSMDLKPELTKDHHRFLSEIYCKAPCPLTFYTIITPFNKNLSAVEKDSTADFKVVSYRNRQIIDLYKTALSDNYTFPSNQIVWKVPNPEKFAFYLSRNEDYEEWKERNAISFEFKAHTGKKFDMLSALNNHLRLDVEVIDSLVDCLFISKNDITKDRDSSVLQPQDQITLKTWINKMKSHWPELHFVDDTKVTVRLKTSEFNPQEMNTMGSILAFLNENDMKVKHEKKALNFLIIK